MMKMRPFLCCSCWVARRPLYLVACAIISPPGYPQGAQSLGAEETRVVTFLRAERERAIRGDVAGALKEALQSRDEVATTFGRPDHWAAAYVLDDIARYRRALKDFDGAYRASVDATEIATKQFGVSNRSAYFSENLTQVAYAAGHCQDALREANATLSGYLSAGANANTDAQRAATSLINLEIQRNDIGAARATFQRIFQAPSANLNDTAAYVLQARLAIADDKLSEATQSLDGAEVVLRSAPHATPSLRSAITLLRAQISIETGDLQTSAKLLDEMLANADLERHEHTEWLLAIQQRARIEGYRGLYSDALGDYAKAYASYSTEFDASSPPLITLTYNLGWIYKGLGDVKRAEVQFNQALASADGCFGPVNPWSVNILLERTRLLLELGRMTAAMSDAQRVVRDADKLQSQRDTYRAYALEARALVERRVGQLAESKADTLRSLDILRGARGNDAWDLGPAFTELADVALLQRDFDGARGWAEMGLHLRDHDGAHTMGGSGPALAQLIEIAATGQRWDDVQKYGTELVNIGQRRLGSSQARSDLVVRELLRSRRFIETLLDGLGRIPETASLHSEELALFFSAAQLPHLTDLTSALQLNADGMTQDPQIRQMLRQRRAVLEELQALQTYLNDPPAQRSSGNLDGEGLFRRSAELEMLLERADADLRKQSPAFAEMLRPTLESVGDVQALLGPKEALYLQVVTDGATHGVLIRANRATYHSSPLGRNSVRRNVSRLRRALDLSLPISQRLPFDTAAASQLYRGTLGEFEKELSGTTDLILILDDAYQNLPPGVLVVSSDPQGSNVPDYLANHYAVVLEPSVGTFRTLRSRQPPHSAKPFVGFGDPVLEGATAVTLRSVSNAGTSDGDLLGRLRSLTPLPETGEELEQIAKILGADKTSIHLKSDFTKADVEHANLSEFAVVSFATHGLLAEDFRGLNQPALVVTAPKDATRIDQGLLTAAEIATLHLNAQLVLLSACNTGRTDEGGGAAGVSALAHAFFFAGADSLLVSHWAVSSQATVALLTRALQFMATDHNVSKSQALRNASLQLLQGSAGNEFRDPAYWAPFVLVGDARPLRLPRSAAR